MLMKTMPHNYRAYLIPCRVGLTKAESFFYQENLKNIKYIFSENHLHTLLHFTEKLGRIKTSIHPPHCLLYTHKSDICI